MNKTIGVIIVLLVIVGGIYLWGKMPKNNYQTNTPGTTQNAGATGRVVFSVTDATMDMSSISEIDMIVSGASVHSDASGWVSASSAPHTYNLLDLNAKNESKVFADASVAAGTYDMVRLSVDKIIVKTKAGAISEAKLPSGELKINTTLVVKSDMTSSVNFDFMADKSLHMTGNGGYIFAPVVKTETKSQATVTVNADSTVNISGGHTDSDDTEGMDIDGSVKANFELKADEKLDIGDDGVISIHGLLNTGTIKTASVGIKNFLFNPVTLTVKTGTKVTWVNDDVVSHTVTSDSGNVLNSGTLSPGQSYSFTFTSEGTFNYYCTLHPMMKGKIIVKD
jgi:plastocyanin